MKLVVLLVALCLFQVVGGTLVTWTVFANLMRLMYWYVLLCALAAANHICGGMFQDIPSIKLDHAGRMMTRSKVGFSFIFRITSCSTELPSSNEYTHTAQLARDT